MSGRIVSTLANDALGGTDAEGMAFLLDTLVTDLGGLAEAQARVALLNAAREFCDRTNVWQDTVSFTAVGGYADYVLTPTTDTARILTILDAQVDGRRVRCLLAPPDIIRFDFQPAAGAAVQVVAAVGPVAWAGAVPAYLVQQHFDALLSGAKTRLHATAGRPYTSAALAQLNARIFTQQMQLARAAVSAARTAGGAAWAFPSFGGRSGSASTAALGPPAPAPGSSGGAPGDDVFFFTSTDQLVLPNGDIVIF